LAHGLQDLDLALQGLDLHGLVIDLGLKVVDRAIAVVDLPVLNPACMAAMASSRHSTSRPGDTPSSRLTGVEGFAAHDAHDDIGFHRLDHHSLSWQPADPAVGLSPSCESTSWMGCFFVMIGIVVTTPKWVSQEVVHRPTRADSE
jgi:hypothetical protein